MKGTIWPDSARYLLILFGLSGLLLSTAVVHADDGGVTLSEWMTLVEEKGTKPDHTKNPAKTCVKCHDEESDNPVLSIFNTPHGQIADDRTPLAQDQACETCHGPSKAHAKTRGKNKPSVAVQFNGNSNPSPPSVQNEVCLGCHESTHINWQGGPHDSEDLSCTSCHDIHATQDPVRNKATQTETCYTCHLEKRVEMSKFTHHPVPEGEMACSDCHNPHGSDGPAQLVKQSVNDTCYTCHAEKRGPFLHEHEPVPDSCVNCHNPHGSTNESMLTMRAPFLCQSCHVAGGHSSRQFTSDRVAPNPTGGNSAYVSVNGCANCHQVHGSNHPAGGTFRR